jgi:hypothetical protein
VALSRDWHNRMENRYALPTSMDIPGRMGPNSMCAHLVRRNRAGRHIPVPEGGLDALWGILFVFD